MSFLRTPHLPAFLAIMLVLAPRLSALTTYSLPLSSASHSYNPFGFPGPSASATLQGVTTTFNTNFNALGQEVLTVEFAAPSGMQFNVAVPSGWNTGSLHFSWQPGNSNAAGAGGWDDTAPQTTFVNLAGASTPTTSSAEVALTGPGHDGAWTNGYFNITPGTSFTFDALDITTTVPASYDMDFSSINPTGIPTLVGTVGVSSGGPPDPGQWISLVAVGVPEPSRALLLLLGGCTLVLGRRRAH